MIEIISGFAIKNINGGYHHHCACHRHASWNGAWMHIFVCPQDYNKCRTDHPNDLIENSSHQEFSTYLTPAICKNYCCVVNNGEYKDWSYKAPGVLDGGNC
jgi:hypothetical protein